MAYSFRSHNYLYSQLLQLFTIVLISKKLFFWGWRRREKAFACRNTDTEWRHLVVALHMNVLQICRFQFFHPLKKKLSPEILYVRCTYFFSFSYFLEKLQLFNIWSFYITPLIVWCKHQYRFSCFEFSLNSNQHLFGPITSCQLFASFLSVFMVNTPVSSHCNSIYP